MVRHLARFLFGEAIVKALLDVQAIDLYDADVVRDAEIIEEFLCRATGQATCAS